MVTLEAWEGRGGKGRRGEGEKNPLWLGADILLL